MLISAKIIKTSLTRCKRESSLCLERNKNAKAKGQQTCTETVGESSSFNQMVKNDSKLKISKNMRMLNKQRKHYSSANIIERWWRRCEMKAFFAIRSFLYFNVLIYVTKSGHILISRFCCHSSLMAMRQKLMHFKISLFSMCQKVYRKSAGLNGTLS